MSSRVKGKFLQYVKHVKVILATRCFRFCREVATDVATDTLHTIRPIRLSQDLTSKFHSLGMPQANPSRQSVDFDAAPRCQLEESFKFKFH